MSSNGDVSELVVRLNPEGTDETQAALEDTQATFEETANVADEESERMSDFADEFQGAMTVVTAALGTAAAGLLSQVPVIGQVAAAFFAIVDSLALKIDQTFRPLLGPVADLLFRVANAINRADGAFGDFLGAVTGVAAGLVALELAVAALANLGIVSIAGPLTALAGVLTGPLAAAIVLVIALVGALAFAWSNNLFNIRQRTALVLEAIRGLIQRFVGFVKPFWQEFTSAALAGRWRDALGVVFDFAGAVFDAILDIVIGFVGAYVDLWANFAFRVIEVADKLKNRVRTIFEVLFDLVRAALQRFGNDVVSEFEGIVNTLITGLPDAITTELGVSTVNFGQPFDPQSVGQIRRGAQRRLTRRDRQAESRRQSRIEGVNQQFDRLIQEMRNTDLDVELNLDGRQVAEATEGLLGNGSANAGRTGSR